MGFNVSKLAITERLGISYYTEMFQGISLICTFLDPNVWRSFVSGRNMFYSSRNNSQQDQNGKQSETIYTNFSLQQKYVVFNDIRFRFSHIYDID